MTDPLSITTGIVTLYSTVWSLRKLIIAYKDAPETVRLLARDCDETLDIVLHTKCRLDNYDRHPTPEDTLNPVDIRQKLRDNINALRPDIDALKEELRTLQRPAETNYAHLKKSILMPNHVSKLKGLQKKINSRLPQFDRLLKSLDALASIPVS